MLFASDDMAKHPACPLCGMDRADFEAAIKATFENMYQDTKMIRKKRKMMRMKKMKKD